MTCTATLTTATVDECPPGSAGEGDHADGAFLLDARGRVTHHVTLHTLTCENHPDGDPSLMPEERRHENAHVQWFDDAPGAQPHRPPLVTDDEFSEALAAFQAAHDGDVDRLALAAALDAAARIRNGGDR